MGFWGFIIGFHKQTKIIKDEETKNFKQTLSSYNGVGWWKLLFYFQGEKTSWGGFWSGIPDMQVKISLMHPAKRLGDAHAKAQEYSIHSWPLCFGGRGVSDAGKMANHHFGSILGLLLFEYISYLWNYFESVIEKFRLAKWQNGKMGKLFQTKEHGANIKPKEMLWLEMQTKNTKI